MNRSPLNLFLIYTVCLVAFSSALANEYLVIPLAACCITRSRWALAYMVVASVFLCAQYDGLNIGWLQYWAYTGPQDGPGVAPWHRLMIVLLLFVLVTWRQHETE